MKKRKVRQLERFKTEINLVEYATSIGYKYLRDESSPKGAVLRHDSGDLIVVVTDTGDRGVYFSLNDDRDRGTIIDFVQHRLDLNLGEVRKELRPWLNRGNEWLIAKPESMNGDRINECLICLKNLNQPKHQPPEPKPKPKKRRQLEP